MRWLALALCCSLAGGWLPARAAGPPRRTPVLIDTDLGGDIDDALAAPPLHLVGPTTVDGDAHTRALLACRLLHATGRADVPVASGAPRRAAPDFTVQMQYGLRPCFRKVPVKESAVDFLYRK